MIDMPSPLLMIGMPVYNGEQYLSRALESLLAQDFDRWRLCIADNQSTDSTRKIAASFASRDPRISYVCHESNLGAVRNFVYLTEMATTPYFMWAAADDEWSSNYASSCIAALEADREVGFAGGEICNTDEAGSRIRDYGAFSAFDASSATERLSHFLASIEADGKANMIYSVFRTDLIRTLCCIPDVLTGWGSDMAFVAGGLSRTRYRQVNAATLYKRVVNESDIRTAKLLAQKRYSEIEFEGNFPPAYFLSYLRALIRAMPSMASHFLVLRVMLSRFFRLSMRTVVGRRS
jgi:glycosyltransferase involved in cell wall biosynthesis